MKLIIFGALLFAIPALSQSVVSPDVQPDGRVTFRLKAPDAKEVQLNCEDVPASKMVRDPQGVWSFTTESLEPDIYTYSFSVDGVPVNDPANPLLKYNLLDTRSEVHVPGPKSLLWEINDVPHGELHQHFYRSTVAGDDRDFIVYTPPGYDPTSSKHYPTLYLLHGFSDDATAWSAVGRANVILDNLIARGQAKPMIIVMPLGYGTMDILKPNASHDPQLKQRNLDGFQKALLGEVMPQVEKSYRVSKSRDMRAIAGLSMGGNEALMTGLNHLDLFAWVGAFSAGGINTNYTEAFPTLNGKAAEKLHLLWIACGREDHLIDSNRQFGGWLNTKNVHYIWIESAGGHTFLNWRRYLCQFAPLLFQDQKRTHRPFE